MIVESLNKMLTREINCAIFVLTGGKQSGGDIMLTRFGKMLRTIRLDRDELLRDMAEKLGVTVAYLSAVENGKRKVPDEWIPKIVDLYELDDDVAEKLQKFAYEERNDLKLNLGNITPDQRELAYSFARRFKNLSSNDVLEMKKILDEKGEK